MVDVINTRVPTIQNVQGAKIRQNWKAIKNRLQNVEAKDTFTSIVTANATTTLGVNSTGIQEFTGTTTQIVILPDTSTLSAGKSFKFINNSTGVITLKDFSNATLTTLSANTNATVTCLSTVTQSWEVEGGTQKHIIGFDFDGSGEVITTGSYTHKAMTAPYKCKIVAWEMVTLPTSGAISGSASIDIIKGTFNSYPFSSPSIVGSEKPILSNALKIKHTLTTPWLLNEGDKIAPVLESCAALTSIVLSFFIEAI